MSFSCSINYRSLGFACYLTECQKTCTNAKGGPKTGTYHRLNIHGEGLEKIPVLLKRKMGRKRKQIKNALVLKISVENIGKGLCYNILFEGQDTRYLLEDFTVMSASVNLK